MKTTTKIATEIGRMFKQIRTDQGMTLAEAAGAEGSVSALSRFERGETDISVAQGQLIARHLGLSDGDLRRLLSDLPGTFPWAAELAIRCQDTVALAHYRDDYLAAHREDADNFLQRIVRLMFKYAMLGPAAGGQLSVDEEQELATFLRYPMLSDLHGCVLLACLPFASAEVLNRIFDWWVVANPQITIFHSLEKQKVLYILAWCALARGDDELLAKVTPGIQEIIAKFSSDMVVFEGAELAVMMQEQLRQPSVQGQGDIESRMAIIDRYTGNAQSNWLRAMMAQAKGSVSVWHNHVIKEPAYNADLADTMLLAGGSQQRRVADGRVVSAVRQCMQLTMAQAAVNWTAATQLRYEQGKLNLRFCNHLELLNRLVIFDNRNSIDMSTYDDSPNVAAQDEIQKYFVKREDNPQPIMDESSFIQQTVMDVYRNGNGWPQWYLDTVAAMVPIWCSAYHGEMDWRLPAACVRALQVFKKARRMTASELNLIAQLTIAAGDDALQIWQALRRARGQLTEYMMTDSTFQTAFSLVYHRRTQLIEQMRAELGLEPWYYADPVNGEIRRELELFLAFGGQSPDFEVQSAQLKKELRFLNWGFYLKVYEYNEKRAIVGSPSITGKKNTVMGPNFGEQ